MFPLGGAGKSVTTPEMVTRAIWPLSSTNQRLPSGPAVTQVEPVGIGNQLKTPAVVSRPAYGAALANHSAPSDPVVIPITCGGAEPGTGEGSGYRCIAPFVVIRPIVAACFSVNHTAPSEPAVRSRMLPVATGTGYSTALSADAAAVTVGIANAIARERPPRSTAVVERRRNPVTSCVHVQGRGRWPDSSPTAS